MQMGFKWIFVLSLALLQAAYYRRMKWSVLKSRKLVVDVVNWSSSTLYLFLSQFSTLNGDVINKLLYCELLWISQWFVLNISEEWQGHSMLSNCFWGEVSPSERSVFVAAATISDNFASLEQLMWVMFYFSLIIQSTVWDPFLISHLVTFLDTL